MEHVILYTRRVTTVTSHLTWLLNSSRILLNNQNRRPRYESLVEAVGLLACNQTYARVPLPDGREDSVSLRNMAPAARDDCTTVLDPSSTLGSHPPPSNFDQIVFDNSLTGGSHNPDVDGEQYAENLLQQK